jgi:bacterioferritin B
MASFQEELNEQIGRELAASHQYVAIALYYSAETLPQLADFFFRQAVEERNHAMMIAQYLLDADAPVRLAAIDAPQTEFADAVAPVALALEQERTVTEQIIALANLARADGELVGGQFLDWFLQEQREEVASVSGLLKTVERASGSSILLAEDYLARVAAAGDAAEAPTPPVAGGAL